MYATSDSFCRAGSNTRHATKAMPKRLAFLLVFQHVCVCNWRSAHSPPLERPPGASGQTIVHASAPAFAAAPALLNVSHTLYSADLETALLQKAIELDSEWLIRPHCQNQQYRHMPTRDNS